jgi:hypothetical protein
LLRLPLLLALGACAAGTPDAWCPPLEGVETVANTGPGVWARDGVVPRLVELWRVGGLAEGQHLAFPIGAAAARDGRIAIPDWMLGEVIVVDGDGWWLGSWTRQGRGPGETLRPAAAAWTAGGEIAVFDVEGSRVVFRSEAGAAAPDIPVSPALTAPVKASGELEWVGVDARGTVALAPGPRSEPRAPELFFTVLLRLPPGAEAPDTVAAVPLPVVREGRYRGWSLPGAPRVVGALAPDGRLAVGGEDAAYRIVVYDAAGEATLQICRDAAPLPLAAVELLETAVPEQMQELAAALRNAPPPERPAPFGRMFFGADGRLWVQRERRDPLGRDGLHGPPAARFDVFDPSGRHLGEVRAPERARLVAAAGDRVWAFETGELDETTVVAYRLVVE